MDIKLLKNKPQWILNYLKKSTMDIELVKNKP